MGEAGSGITKQFFSMLHEQENSKELMGKTQRIIWSLKAEGAESLTGTTRAGDKEG